MFGRKLNVLILAGFVIFEVNYVISIDRLSIFHSVNITVHLIEIIIYLKSLTILTILKITIKLLKVRHSKINASFVHSQLLLVCDGASEPKIFKLEAGLLDEIFDYLPLETLMELGATCKKMDKITGDYFRQTFKSRVRGENGNIYTESVRVKLNSFIAYVRRVFLGDGKLQVFARPNRSPSPKEIEFFEGKLTSIENVTRCLPKVESLKFIYSELDTDVHDTFLSRCGNLKRLAVRDTNSNGSPRRFFVGTSDEWLTKKYSSLEYFEVNSKRKVDQVIKFLEKNPSIATFATTYEFFMANLDAISTSKIRLNTLAILHEETPRDVSKYQTFVKGLPDLRNQGLFKELHAYFQRTKLNHSYPSRLLPHVTVLHITLQTENFALAQMVYLKQLYLFGVSRITDLETAIDKLTRLNYIYFACESFDNIIPFIHRLRHLRKIRIDNIVAGPYFNDKTNVLDVPALNAQRRRLKVDLTIYVDEDVFTATKSAVDVFSSKYIILKRTQSENELQDFTERHGALF